MKQNIKIPVFFQNQTHKKKLQEYFQHSYFYTKEYNISSMLYSSTKMKNIKESLVK